MNGLDDITQIVDDYVSSISKYDVETTNIPLLYHALYFLPTSWHETIWTTSFKPTMLLSNM